LRLTYGIEKLQSKGGLTGELSLDIRSARMGLLFPVFTSSTKTLNIYTIRSRSPALFLINFEEERFRIPSYRVRAPRKRGSLVKPVYLSNDTGGALEVPSLNAPFRLPQPPVRSNEGYQDRRSGRKNQEISHVCEEERQRSDLRNPHGLYPRQFPRHIQDRKGKGRAKPGIHEPMPRRNDEDFGGLSTGQGHRGK
jgi:hypothetical protein